jgi:hypothetical protein
MLKAKPIVYSAAIAIGAAWIYWHLISGGWLNNHYELNDPNLVNLALAIFEPIAVLVVIAYWIWRTRFWRRLLFTFFLFHLVIGAGFAAFILFFALTWKPKLM